MRFYALISALALAACSASTEAPAPKAGGGWAIEPGDDLGAFLDCIEKEGASLIAAHRGGPEAGYPENALQTFEHTLAQVPALLEIDVATSSDGVLYLMHDDRLERTTTGEGDANALPWSAIEQLRLEDDHGAATDFAPTRFDDALAWAKGRTILEVDFKPTTSFAAVAAEIKRQQAEDRIILIAYTLGQAEKLHALLPEAMISLSINSISDLNRAVAAGVPADRIVAFTGVEKPDPHLYDALEDRDVEVIFGTLGGRDSIDNEIASSGDGSLYSELSEEGVDIIATDRPEAANAALKTAGRAVKPGACGIARGE